MYCSLFFQPDDAEYSKNVEEVLESTTSNLAYMVDLLQVQFMRGCTNGERFTQLLKSKLQQETSSMPASQVCCCYGIFGVSQHLDPIGTRERGPRATINRA